LPMDDEHSWWFNVAPPLDPPILKPGQLTPGDTDPATDPTIGYEKPGSWRRIRNKDNDYLIDRNVQRTVNFTGIPGNRGQDAAMTESMGSIPDRSIEHLGTTDMAIIFWRRYLMRLARQLQQGIEPPLLHRPDLFNALPIQATTDESDFAQVWDRREEFTAAAPGYACRL